VAAASRHLARLGARARPAGSAATDAARRYCADILRTLGFTVREQAFEYSKFPGAVATPVAGLVVVIFAAGLVAARPLSLRSGLTLLAAACLVGLGFAYVGARGVLTLAVARSRGVNLEAVRGDREPNVWLVAHLDSKWQPVSMITRVAGVVGSSIGLITLAAAASVAGVPDKLMYVLFGLTCLGAIPLMLSYVGDRNHGALDNASGVATVLEAVEMIGDRASIGVVITDAEELALAGAHAWASTRKPAVALNCDSVDDVGDLVVMYSGRRPGPLVEALAHAAQANAERMRVIRLIPGILTDHVALAGRGWTTVTLSRGTARTLWRIHTSRDTLETMDGRGIAGAARVLAHSAMELG